MKDGNWFHVQMMQSRSLYILWMWFYFLESSFPNNQQTCQNNGVEICSDVGFYFSCKFSQHLCFVHPIFCFLFLVTFGDEVTKIRKYYVIFVYILQGKMGKTEKRKENHATEVTKRQKYGRNETLGVIFVHWPKLWLGFDVEPYIWTLEVI